MIFDFDIPWLEFRFRIQLFCAERWGIFHYIHLELKIPWISWAMLFNNGFSISPLIYKYYNLIQIGKMPRQGCFKVIILNKKFRDYYDKYEIQTSRSNLNGK